MNKKTARICKKTLDTVKKMPCGREITIGVFGTIKSYRCKKTGKRMFSLSNTGYLPPSGNLSAKTICSDLTQFYSHWI